ncbi:MAG: glycosyltransferase family 2 protein [Candidatus Endonucleobacter sp. (ex Gigantidas childressi)]|nr:glycosyltransferase family 2 protein [Candidatus Endonucleobacter sp. (ex Gigantidas childressi)]
MKLSIVTTLYQSSLYINEFYSRITKEAKKITNKYEIIFVDDGSPDDSLQKAISLYEKDKKIKVIELSRNFGHHKAIMTGLSHAKGDFVFLIDVDLEEEPELLGEFWGELHKEESLDVVYGIQESRKGNWFERWSGDIFYKSFNKISYVTLPRNLITCRLTTKEYNQALISHKEREVFLAGLWVISGFNQKEIVVKKYSHSETTYSFRHKLSLLFYALTSFSIFPLKVIFYTGSMICFISFLYILFIILRKLIFDVSLEGWVSLIVSIWFLGGLILFSIGVIGIYISKIFTETKQRPYTVIRKKYESIANE